MWQGSYWNARFWPKNYWEKRGKSPSSIRPGSPYWEIFWQKGYWNARYWPGTGALPPPFVPPAVVTGPPPPQFVFLPPLTYDWVRTINVKSFISKVSYNAAFKTMAINYKDGALEIYLNVGLDVAESLTSSFSPDSFFGNYIFGKYGKQ